MSNVEKILLESKEEMESIEVPCELETRLKGALAGRTFVKRKSSLAGRIAAAIMVFMLIGYNFDTLAFYGRKLLGYSDVMNGTLNELNELGKGQAIGKSCSFKNGVTVTLDGIMLDENQLIAFYTVSSPKGNVDEIMPRVSLRGLVGECTPEGGQALMNDGRTLMKNMQSFEPPRVFEKTLHMDFQIWEGGKAEQNQITFKIDRQEAMGHTWKADIGKSIKADKAKIRFESILASPTQTVIKGTIQNPLELAMDEMTKQRLRPNEMELRLYANGKEVQLQGYGVSTNVDGIKFHCEYDALPQEVKSLELRLARFSADHDVNEVFEISGGKEIQRLDVKGREITINKVLKSNGNTFVTLTTQEGTVLTRVYLQADGKQLELSRTVDDAYEKLTDGRILHTRTLEFSGTGNDCKLDIRRMTYTKEYDKSIEIPVK